MKRNRFKMLFAQRNTRFLMASRIDLYLKLCRSSTTLLSNFGDFPVQSIIQSQMPLDVTILCLLGTARSPETFKPGCDFMAV